MRLPSKGKVLGSIYMRGSLVGRHGAGGDAHVVGAAEATEDARLGAKLPDEPPLESQNSSGAEVRSQVMKRSLGRWTAIAVGATATIGSAVIGLANLQRRSHKEAPAYSFQYFLDEDRLHASLMDSEVFSSPRVGYAGAPPPVASEFLGLLADARAQEKFMELVAQGAPGGRLYGLCGLRLIGSKRLGGDPSFVARWDNRRVAIMRGCSLSVTTPRKVVQSPDFENVCNLWKASREVALPNPALNPTGLRPAG
jgi:hypothetical protein